MFNICFINYFANVSTTFKFVSCTLQLWCIDVGCDVWNLLSEGLWHQRLVYLVFHISSYVEVTWSNVQVSRGPRNRSCFFFQAYGRFLTKKSLTAIWKWGRFSSFWKYSCSRKSTFNWLNLNSLLAHTVDFHGLLMNASRMCSTVSTITRSVPVLLRLQTPFVYRFLVPTSVWIHLRQFITILGSEVPPKYFRRTCLMNQQAAMCLLHSRRNFPLIVIEATLVADMLQSLLPLKT